MNGRQQVIREDRIDRIKQALLTDRGNFHKLQKQHGERKHGHQNKECRLSRKRTDSILTALAQYLQDEIKRTFYSVIYLFYHGVFLLSHDSHFLIR